MQKSSQRNQIVTRILFIGMLAVGALAFVFSFVAKLLISSLDSMGYWLTSLGIGFMIIGGVGIYYTRYYYVGQVSVSRFANSGTEIIIIAGVCIIGVVLSMIGCFGLINWLRNL